MTCYSETLRSFMYFNNYVLHLRIISIIYDLSILLSKLNVLTQLYDLIHKTKLVFMACVFKYIFWIP